jgi:peptidoglycan/xylan/chitin deacetylase (PgdA/CDA1 family)
MIRRFLALIAAVAVSGLLQLAPAFVQAAAPNLIANNSVETASTTNAQLPQSWNTGRWGTNTTTFSYLNNGHSGGHSIAVQMTSYASGDAKWYFNPVSVTPGSTYTYSDYYMSSVKSDVLAAFIDSSGNYTYKYLSTPAASPLSWQQYTKSFTIPAGTAKMTIFHMIYSVGSLQTDDYSLTQNSSTQVAITAPGSGQALSGTVNVTADASDTGGIGNVQFQLDGQPLGNAVTTSPYTYSWDTTSAANGSHSLTAVATNTSGQSTTSDPVTVTVNNQTTGGTPGSSLLPNSDLETIDPANSSRPLNWRPGRWGTNTYAHTYLSTGHNSGHSVKTEITQYTNGAAYWYNLDQPVTAGKTYTFSDYFQSNTQSEVDLGVNMSDGTIKYIYLGSAGASPTTWMQFQKQFTAPAGAVSINVYHEIFSVGWLTVDDYSLTQTDPAPVSSNLITNPSVETPNPNNPNKPDGWISSSWGTNTASLSYLSGTAHSGTRSIKAQITQYTSGAAHWATNTIAVTPGQTYDYSEYYMSNTTTQVLAAFKMSDGSTQYVWLGSPFTSSNSWTKFRKQFTVPAGAVSLNMYHELYSAGWVITDDYSLSTFAYQGFNRPLITITDDDGYTSFNKYGLPLLKQYGFSSTDYIITDDPTRGPSYVNDAMIKELYNGGQEIGSHSITHPDLTTLSASQLNNELGASQTYLQNLLGIPVPNFAAPYGSYNQQVLDNAKQYYRSFRTVDSGYNAKNNFDPYHIMVQNLHANTTLAEFQSWVDQAKATNTWLVLVYHQVDPNATDTYNTFPTDFNAQLNAIKTSGIPVRTVNQALDELIPQL